MIDTSGADTAVVEVLRPSPHVALVRIDRPPVNAFGAAETHALLTAIAALNEDPDVRCIVITGSGRAFSAGADLRLIRGVPENERQAFFAKGDQMTALFDVLASCRTPIIAAVNGVAFGGGLELALCCDIRLASRSARFGASAVKIGLLMSCYLLPRLIGQARATEMLLTGQAYDADRALEWGLVTQVHDDADLLDQAVALASVVASRPPLAAAAVKQVARRATEIGADASAALHEAEFFRLLATADHGEAVAAFVEKREPHFTGT